MKRKIVLIQVLFTVILSILCCFALIACGGEPKAPEVKNVTITAVDGNSYGKAGALHKVTYTVPEGSKVATSVKIGDSFATVADYSYIDEGYVFYTAGEYTITVYASKDGMLGHSSAKITIHDGEASVSDVKITAAAGEAFGKVGALHVLTYVADTDCEIQIEIKKDGSPATDVEFNDEYNTLIFRSAGNYTVKVTATIGTASDSAETQIEIGVADAPSVSLSLDKNTVEEDGEVTLNHTVTYHDGDYREKESVSALYRAGTTGEFREAGADTYTVIGDRFTPHVAGEWKVVYKAQCNGGGVGEASAALTCTPAEISLSAKTTERQRIRTENPTNIDYLVEGAADKYNVTYDLHGNNRIEAEKGDGNSVRVTAADVDYFTVTVVYTHKVVSSIQKTVDIDLYSVESLVYAPAFSADPFAGMPSEVLTSMGHLLYFDVTACAFHNRELTYENVQYEIKNSNISSGKTASIMYAADDTNYPYVIVSDFKPQNSDGGNSATGSFMIKMTATDPVTGYSVIAYKDFTVTPTYNNTAVICNYLKNNAFYRIEQMNFANASQFSQENMVLTKTGTIIHRRNATDFSPGTFARLDFDQAAANCRLEFKFNVVGVHPATGEVWFGIGVRTATWEGWASYFDLRAVGGRLDITCGFNEIKEEYVFKTERPLAVNGATMYVRIDRRVNGTLAEYTVYAKTEESAPYESYYRCRLDTSVEPGKAGAPVKAYQFDHRLSGSCYSVEDVVITSYDA